MFVSKKIWINEFGVEVKPKEAGADGAAELATVDLEASSAGRQMSSRQLQCLQP